MWLLALPLALILVALVLAAVVLGVAISVLAELWPLVLVAAGVWLLFRGGRHPRDHAHGRRVGHPRHPPARRQAPARPRPEPKPATATRPALPPDVQEQVERIRRKAQALLASAERFPPFSHDLYLVRQTADDYLPRTIATYLSLPTESANGVVGATGTSALQELREQLGLLEAKLDEIAQDLQRQNLDRLLANRLFLQERFGRAGAEATTGGGASGDDAARSQSSRSG